jgi:hypothetical protein|mmetsp:Transcript_16727/g.29193  ORF Transcript_16727/g.29193 Transcript_16727/m.29193 type:complete len:225 (+) Transcript_16727:336-1010(+)
MTNRTIAIAECSQEGRVRWHFWNDNFPLRLPCPWDCKEPHCRPPSPNPPPISLWTPAAAYPGRPCSSTACALRIYTLLSFRGRCCPHGLCTNLYTEIPGSLFRSLSRSQERPQGLSVVSQEVGWLVCWKGTSAGGCSAWTAVGVLQGSAGISPTAIGEQRTAVAGPSTRLDPPQHSAQHFSHLRTKGFLTPLPSAAHTFLGGRGSGHACVRLSFRGLGFCSCSP